MNKKHKKEKVAMIYPSYTAFQKRSIGWESNWIHHGIASIIAYAKKEGIIINLIDLRRLRSCSEFENIIKEYKYVCLSILTQDVSMANICIEKIKEINNNAIVIVGGVHPSIMPKDFIDNRKIDYIITGEGEISLTNLIKSLMQGVSSSQTVIEGVKPELDNISYVNRELWLPEENSAFGFKSPFFTLISSRACLRNCKFCQPCSRIVFGNKERNRSVKHVIGELKSLRKKYGLKSFMFLDDNILQNKKWIEEFIAMYKQEKFDAEFAMSASVNFICRNEEIMQELSEIGCRWFIVGFESGSQRVLDFLRKGTTVEQNKKATKILRRYNIKIMADIMFGVPTETREEAMKTVSLVREIKPEILSITFYTPYPGSDLAKYCEENDLIIPYRDYAELARYANRPKIKGIDYRFLYECIALCYLYDEINFSRRLKIKINSYLIYFITRYKKYIPKRLIELGKLSLEYLRKKKGIS